MSNLLHDGLSERIREHLDELDGAVYRQSASRIARDLNHGRGYVYRRLEAMREAGELTRHWTVDHYLYERTEDPDA